MSRDPFRFLVLCRPAIVAYIVLIAAVVAFAALDLN